RLRVMSFRIHRTVGPTSRSTWSALALDADAAPEVAESRLVRIQEVSSVWPSVVFALLLAPIVVGFIVRSAGHTELIPLVAIRGSVIAAMAFAALAQLKIETA